MRGRRQLSRLMIYIYRTVYRQHCSWETKWYSTRTVHWRLGFLCQAIVGIDTMHSGAAVGCTVHTWQSIEVCVQNGLWVPTWSDVMWIRIQGAKILSEILLKNLTWANNFLLGTWFFEMIFLEYLFSSSLFVSLHLVPIGSTKWEVSCIRIRIGMKSMRIQNLYSIMQRYTHSFTIYVQTYFLHM